MFKRLIVIVLLLSSCTREINLIPQEFLSDPAFYFKESNQVTLDVFYEEGAEPFVGDINISSTVLSKRWDLTRVNLEEIFSFKSEVTSLDVPTELNQMTQIPELDKDTWMVEDVVDLARDYDVNSKADKNSIFSVFFVKGFFEDEAGVKNNVVGLNLSGTSIVIIFKDVILNMPEVLQVFSEQATVVHEVGHALGLVDNGVPATGGHFDGLNGAHSNEDNCIMFHLNEGAADLIPFITALNTSGDATIWGSGVLSDVEAFSE